jgi:hypothetical protein
MSNFDELFCNLIRTNRRVIIPDIGAFITDSSDENTVFSPLLKHNDGFLEDEIQKKGIANPAVFLRELAENIISVVERGQHYHIAGLGYFFKDGSIRFAFEETEKDVVSEHFDDVVFPENNDRRSKSRIIASAICLILIVLVALIFFIFRIHSSNDRHDMFVSQQAKPDGQFTIVEKSDTCAGANDLQTFPQARSYHVVVACFEDEDNAAKFVVQCKKNGYAQAEILSMTDVFYPVSIGASASPDEALNKKQEYDQRFGENAMILKTK